ncbi:MAG: HAMP domain-containing histidine kinase [Prevotella sp.]|nr:HAMP domain-containing histidine kinase [Prevotella sp.]
MNHLIVYVMAFFLISVFVLLFYNRLYIIRERDAKAETDKQSDRLALVLKTGNLRLWLYDVSNRHYITLSEVGEYEHEYNPVDFSSAFDRDDFENMRKEIFDICEGRKSSSSASLKSNSKKKEDLRYFDVKLSIFTTDDKSRVKLLLGIEHDVTESYKKQQEINRLLMRYHTVFDSSLVDMLYYDKNGVLIDINEKACGTFNIPTREDVLQGNYLLRDNPFFSNVSFRHMMSTRTTSIISVNDFTDQKDKNHINSLIGTGDKLYYESTISNIYNAEGELEGFYMAGRGVTEMVESYHRQQESINILKKVNSDIEKYIANINYALRVSDVRLMNYFPKSYTLKVSSNVNSNYLTLSQLRCIRLASPRFRRTVSSVLNRMDHLVPHPIEETIETEIRDKKGRPMWQMFQMVPIKDNEGNIEYYFGLCRNMTDMIETERRLAVETQKAQETELLKQSFVTNMSYEIRTPLNTVVGFAELFESEHDVADEPVFVEEIKRNSNSLLGLVNDILFLSRLDANMLEFSKSYIDFAQIFESHCQMGWSSVRPTVKTMIENPYEHLLVNIDQEHLGMVIQKLCFCSVNHTERGYIRAKYEYRHGELTISIEDTGSGIDQQTLPHAFERFVRDQNENLYGTGLDLPIVQSLVQQMGGSVELQSEINKGTTVWITIPCKAKNIEKKREIV